jgi:nucleoside-diphosphate-sugar epimerase
MMRILVTGSSGFIGGHLVHELVRHGHDVLGLDRVAPHSVVPRMAFAAVDLLDRDLLIDIFANFRPEAVVHLAARTDLNEQRDLAGYASNIQGVDNLVAAVRATRGVRRAIYTSSQLVCRVGYIPKTDDDYQPSTLYGMSKVRTEQIVRGADGGGVEWCIVRPTLVWGPGMGPHYQRFFQMISKGRYFHVGGKPLFKSYGYIGNVVYQYLKLLTVDGSIVARRTFYLADYEPISLRDWADGFQRRLEAPRIKTVPELFARGGAALGDALNRLGWRGFPYNSFRLGNVLTEYVFDLTPTREVCGPLPWSVEDGIGATVRWLRGAAIVSNPTAIPSANEG